MSVMGEDGLEKNLNELLAESIQQDPELYASSLLKGFREGDAVSVKIVQAALEEAKYKEEDKFPIDDKRIEEIVCLLADNIRAVKA